MELQVATAFFSLFCDTPRVKPLYAVFHMIGYNFLQIKSATHSCAYVCRIRWHGIHCPRNRSKVKKGQSNEIRREERRVSEISMSDLNL